MVHSTSPPTGLKIDQPTVQHQSTFPPSTPENFSDHLLRRRHTMMHMTFYWGRKMVLLFDSWKTDSWASYSLSLLALFLFSLFYQYMEDRRLRLKLLSSSSKPSPPAASDAIGAPLLPRRPYGGRSSARVAVALLFGINSAIGYLLMLSVMSYNGGVFVAVVLGLAVGYLVFRSGEEGLVFVENSCACA